MTNVELKETLFEGVVSFRRSSDWLQPLRMKADELPLHHEEFVKRAVMPGGCRLRFVTDSTRLVLDVEPTTDELPRPFDLTTDEERLEAVIVEPGSGNAEFKNLPVIGKPLEI